MKDGWKHWLKSYLACMNDCSDPKRNDNFFDSTKVFMPYFDQVYVKTCLRQVWKIVKCKLLEVFLLVTCKSVGLNWPIERSHVLLLFYLSCKLKRVGRLHDVKQLFSKPVNDKNCFKLPLRYKLNQVWKALTCSFDKRRQSFKWHVLCTCNLWKIFHATDLPFKIFISLTFPTTL